MSSLLVKPGATQSSCYNGSEQGGDQKQGRAADRHWTQAMSSTKSALTKSLLNGIESSQGVKTSIFLKSQQHELHCQTLSSLNRIHTGLWRTQSLSIGKYKWRSRRNVSKDLIRTDLAWSEYNSILNALRWKEGVSPWPQQKPIWAFKTPTSYLRCNQRQAGEPLLAPSP